MTPLEIAELCYTYGFVVLPAKFKRPVVRDWTNFDREKGYRITKSCLENNRANTVGILCGEKSGIVVVDIDVGFTKADPTRTGVDFWKQLVMINELPETFTVKTGSNGYHCYFRYDDRTRFLKNAVSAIKGYSIDVRTTGGFIVSAGNQHENGNYYLVDDGYSEGRPVIAPMPDWLLGLLLETQVARNR